MASANEAVTARADEPGQAVSRRVRGGRGEANPARRRLNEPWRELFCNPNLDTVAELR
jgi:hypothetical protein